jgi:hypothetical protein
MMAAEEVSAGIAPQYEQVSSILESLSAETPQQLSVLRGLVAFAQGLQSRAQRDLGFAWAADLAKDVCSAFGLAADFPRWLATLPEESKTYFYGLVEALEIYQSIHGRWIAVSSLTPGDTSVQELKQIRDLCLQDGLRSIY